jgi:hypothetical protein
VCCLVSNNLGLRVNVVDFVLAYNAALYYPGVYFFYDNK